jgi:hypothetical protein
VQPVARVVCASPATRVTRLNTVAGHSADCAELDLLRHSSRLLVLPDAPVTQLPALAAGNTDSVAAILHLELRGLVFS